MLLYPLPSFCNLISHALASESFTLSIRLFPNSSLFRVTSHQVEVAHGNAVLPLDADALILAIGTESDKSLQDKELDVPTYRIGDCDHIGDAREAVAQGAELGVTL